MLLAAAPAQQVGERLLAVPGACACLPALLRAADPDVKHVAADLLGSISRHAELKAVLEHDLRHTAQAMR